MHVCFHLKPRHSVIIWVYARLCVLIHPNVHNAVNHRAQMCVRVCMCVRMRRQALLLDLCVSVYNWRQRENLWAYICSWFFGDNKSGLFHHWCASTQLSLSLVRALDTLTFSSSSPHFLNPVETQGLVVQSSCKTLDWASGFWVATQAELWKLLPGQSRM